MAPKPGGYVELTLKFEREGDKWVGTCLELGTSTFSNTLNKAQQDLRNLIAEHLNLLEEAGERQRFFEEWDITLHPAKPKPHDIRIRDSSIDWGRLTSQLGGAHGPFFQPVVFPIRGLQAAPAGG